jgi:hypothetical protein
MLFIFSVALAASPALAVQAESSSATCSAATLPSKVLISAPPTGAKGPDDITTLPLNSDDEAGGTPLIWVAYQNGINPDGTPGTTNGPTQSTIAGYNPSTGALVKTISVTGKVDGLTADQALGKLIATVNEDANSGLNLIDPATGTVTFYTYSPSPEVSGNGGTDSIAVRGGTIIISHSNPNDASQATDYRVTLVKSTHTAKLTPTFNDNSPAKDAITGATVTLGLTDPDTNFFMPRAGERFGGSLATIAQADGHLVFASRLGGTPRIWVLTLTDNKAARPPTDGLSVATSGLGTLYVVDNGANKIYALDTSGCARGTVFIGEPKDNGNPMVGTLNLHTGVIHPLSNSFASPKGLLFVPAPDHEGGD